MNIAKWMRYRRNYFFDKWTNWNHQINDSIKDFFKTYGVYPNILEASTHTFSQIDFLVSIMPDERNNLKHINEEKVEVNKDAIIAVCSFENSICSVDFSVNDKINDKTYDLIYDSDPDWNNSNTFDFPLLADEIKTLYDK